MYYTIQIFFNSILPLCIARFLSRRSLSLGLFLFCLLLLNLLLLQELLELVLGHLAIPFLSSSAALCGIGLRNGDDEICARHLGVALPLERADSHELGDDLVGGLGSLLLEIGDVFLDVLDANGFEL